MKQIKAIYKGDNLVFKYLVVFNNYDLGLRLSCTKHVSYACLEVDGMDKYFKQGDFGAEISFNDLSPRVKAAIRSFAWRRGLIGIKLNKTNIPFIVFKHFPCTRGFVSDWTIEEMNKTFHFKSDYACYDHDGDCVGFQKFTVIINKDWRKAKFQLRFNAPRYLSDKHDLRGYIEDALENKFDTLFDRRYI